MNQSFRNRFTPEQQQALHREIKRRVGYHLYYYSHSPEFLIDTLSDKRDSKAKQYATDLLEQFADEVATAYARDAKEAIDLRHGVKQYVIWHSGVVGNTYNWNFFLGLCDEGTIDNLDNTATDWMWSIR